MKKKDDQTLLAFNRLHSAHKLIISLALAIIVYLLVPVKNTNSLTHVMTAWDTFCVAALALNWITFFTITSRQIRAESSRQDESRVVIFIIVLIATIAALAAVILLVTSKSEHTSNKAIELPIAFLGLMSSWLLVHTVFTFRYAHMYYSNDETDANTHAGGLDFPQEEHPDFIDFAYFSFVIGMTFQVSDVEISSKELRRLALLHSLIAFGFNTVVVALTINILAGLGQK